jgi:catechol 2,3-dioxygenase-like lactoylglutathione lyase family enzyme
MAFVVPDFDQALDTYVRAGIGPAFTLRRLRGLVGYRGAAPRECLMSVAFVHTGEVVMEIIGLHDDTPTSYREFLEHSPAGGLHHIAYYSDDFAESVRQAAAAGSEYRVVQEFFTPASEAPFEIYMEPVGAKNPVCVQLMKHGPSDAWFGEMKAISRSWDGSDPIRDAIALMPAGMRPATEPA